MTGQMTTWEERDAPASSAVTAAAQRARVSPANGADYGLVVAAAAAAIRLVEHDLRHPRDEAATCRVAGHDELRL